MRSCGGHEMRSCGGHVRRSCGGLCEEVMWRFMWRSSDEVMWGSCRGHEMGLPAGQLCGP